MADCYVCGHRARAFCARCCHRFCPGHDFTHVCLEPERREASLWTSHAVNVAVAIALSIAGVVLFLFALNGCVETQPVSGEASASHSLECSDVVGSFDAVWTRVATDCRATDMGPHVLELSPDGGACVVRTARDACSAKFDATMDECRGERSQRYSFDGELSVLDADHIAGDVKVNYSIPTLPGNIYRCSGLWHVELARRAP